MVERFLLPYPALWIPFYFSLSYCCLACLPSAGYPSPRLFLAFSLGPRTWLRFCRYIDRTPFLATYALFLPDSHVDWLFSYTLSSSWCLFTLSRT